MNEKTREILRKLRENEIDIEEAMEILNVTEDEIWDLLDSFDYFPSGKILRRACHIERESLRKLEEKIKKKTRSTSQRSRKNIIFDISIAPSGYSVNWLAVDETSVFAGASEKELLDSMDTYEFIKDKIENILYLLETAKTFSDTSKRNLLLQHF